MALHSLLKRQLKKSRIDENSSPDANQWQDFLERVNRSYHEIDQERYLLERSVALSSKEMQELYEKLQKSETRYALASKGAHDGLWDWDLAIEEIYYSERCLEIVGVAPVKDQLFSRAWWFDRVHPEDKEELLKKLKAHFKGETEHFRLEHRILHEDGSYRWIYVRGLAYRDENGVVNRFAGSFSDITERKATEQKLEHDAIHDSLTGLPNRKFLMERLARSLDRTKFKDKYSFGVLFIDLDRFKIINDTLGHLAGDELLLKISNKLKLLIRPSDMVARLGGDEFVVLIENTRNDKQIFKIAERIIRELQKPVEIAGQQVYSNASIGVVFGSPDYTNSHDLVRDADIAMYCAKLKGRGRYELFDPEMHSGAVSQLQTENDLRRALEKKEFILYYQPIISLIEEQIVGFEALLRWIHPARGLVMPNDFIPIAEENRLILPIGEWVIYEACRQMKEWQELYPAAASFIMNVNLSAVQLEEEGLIDQIKAVLKETRLSPNSLKLEITESVLMKNTQKAIKTVSELRDMGIKVSIDDFGTGYSSLSYLHNFSIDTLKVDRSFINLIGSEKEKTEIIQTIITLAASLGIDVVAEGVETEEQLNFLRENNCSFGQGFYYSRPVNNVMAEKMLADFVENGFALGNESNQLTMA